jgi:hypothetical protein
VNILGIIASSKLSAVGDYESIATVTVGSGGSATVEFTSIPALISTCKLGYCQGANRATNPVTNLHITV